LEAERTAGAARTPVVAAAANTADSSHAEQGQAALGEARIAAAARTPVVAAAAACTAGSHAEQEQAALGAVQIAEEARTPDANADLPACTPDTSAIQAPAYTRDTRIHMARNRNNGNKGISDANPHLRQPPKPSRRMRAKTKPQTPP